ncbi:MAG TPA: hypothetical protein VFN42_00310, partial [Acetobacteraceae bacterium]|nr:hypothetical protein [Acetobacteraceae bacterium]
MTIEPSTAAPTKPPGQTGGRAVPEGITRVLVLLRWIIGYGRNLADTFHQRAADAAFRDFAAIRFHTPDLNAIFARVRRGLMLALALEAKLLKRAATGRELVEAPVRSGTPPARPSGTARKPHAARRSKLIDLPLDHLPTAQQIADELRRRPLGAILV